MVLIEKELIGTLILYPKNILKVISKVKPEDFVDNQASIAFISIISLWKEKKTVSLASVSFIGKSIVQYVSEATQSATPFGAVDNAKRISLLAKERRVNNILGEIAKNNEPVMSKLESVMKLYNDESFVDAKDPHIIKVIERLEKNVLENKKNGVFGIKTGFGFLEEKYIRYTPGHIWVIGGFTSTGKTATVVQHLVNIIIDTPDKAVIFISTEMTEEQLLSRIISNMTGIHSYRILSGNYRPGEEEMVFECKKTLETRKIFIYDDVYTLADIENVFRKEELQGGVDIGIIDYIQNCQVPDAKSEYQEQSTLAKRIQKLAKDVRANIICLSQVSNDVGRGNTDQLEFKGAGEWAAVTDIGVMLQRSKKDDYKLKYMVKKNRHGAKTEGLLEYKLDFCRLEEI